MGRTFKFHSTPSCSVILCDLLPVRSLPHASSPPAARLVWSALQPFLLVFMGCTASKRTSAAQQLRTLRRCPSFERIRSAAVLLCSPEHFDSTHSPNTQRRGANRVAVAHGKHVKHRLQVCRSVRQMSDEFKQD